MIVVLDNIRSCHNVGSIFRTVDCAGGSGVYLCGYTPGPLNKYGFENNKLTKVSLGAEQSVKWQHFQSTVDAVNKLKEDGYKVYAVEQTDDSIVIQDARSEIGDSKKTAFVFGNEKDGVSEDVLEVVDKKIEIPMHGQKKSLNVATTVGVVLFILN